MSQGRLLKERRFYPLFWTQFLGSFNDNFLKNALVILITFKATSVLGIPAAQMVAVAGGIFILPFFLFSATAGQLADKYEKSKIVRIIKIVEIGIMALAMLGFLTEHFAFLLAVLFLMGLHSTFFAPIKYSILPQHLRHDELVGGNALIEAGTFLSILIGTIAGGVLIALPDGPWIVSGVLVLVSILGYVTSRAIQIAPPVDPGLTVQWNPVPQTFAIWRFVAENRVVYLSILANSWFWFFGAAMLSLFPPFCKDALNADQSVVTLFLAMFSIGIGIGSLLCERLSGKRLELGLVPLGSIGMTVFTADLAFQGAPRLAQPGPVDALTFASHSAGIHILIDLLMISVSAGLFIVPLYTLMQERSASTHRSRVIAGNNVINALFLVASAVMIVGLMSFGFTIPEIFLVIAALNALMALFIYWVIPEFIVRFLLWTVASLFYRVRYEGGELIPNQGPAVLVCNHVSYVDWLFIGASIKRPVCFVMDYNFAKGWFMSRICRIAKIIPIALLKEDPEVLRQSFVKIADALRGGDLVCIFPEGTLTRDGKTGPFKAGIEKVIRETPVPVIPLAVSGMWGSFFSRERGTAIKKIPSRFWSRVTLRVGEPVPASEVSAEMLQLKVVALCAEPRRPS